MSNTQNQYVDPSITINYISEWKKNIVGRNNNPVSQKVKIDNRIKDTYYFQIVNKNNQIVTIDDDYQYEFLGSFVDAKNQMHTLFYSDTYTISQSNVIAFKVNTFTSEYLYNVKRPREIELTIKKKNLYDETIILRDSGIAYPTPIEPGVEPTPVVAGWGLNLNGYVMSLDRQIPGSLSIGYYNELFVQSEIGEDGETMPAIAIGNHLDATTPQQVVVGRYSEPCSTATFIIGDGDQYNRHNAFVVGWDDGTISGGTFYSNGVRLATIDDISGSTYTAGEGIGISDQNVISLTATIPSSITQLNGNTYLIRTIYEQNSITANYWVSDPEGGCTWKVGVDYNSLHNAGFAYTSAIPTSTSQLTNDSDFVVSSTLNNYALKTDIPSAVSELENDTGFITSSALTGISTDKLQKIVIDETTQDSGYVMQYDPTADVVYNTIITDNGLLTLNAVSGFENDIEIGKAATFENWVKVQGNLTGVAVGQGLNLIGELPEEFNSNNTQVFSRRIARINRDTTIQQISYNYDFYETPIPLTLKSNGSTTVTLSAAGSPDAVTLSSRINDGEWTSYSVGNAITLTDGDEVSFKGINDHFSKTSNDKYTFVVEGDGTIEAYGSVKSLIGEDSTMNNYCFNKLFHSCAKLTDASKLVLPDKDLKEACFRNMFYMCTALTAIPEVKAEQIPYRACSYMFSNCQSLTKSPNLHAKVLSGEACRNMFAYDYALTAAPEIPAETVYYSACLEMFNNCSSMVTPPSILPAKDLTQGYNCYQQMFSGCVALTAAPELPATNLANNCYQSMFQGCTSLVNGPSVLPASGLYAYCYEGMFRNCSSLTAAPQIKGTQFNGSYCCNHMFRNCSSLSALSVWFRSWLSPWSSDDQTYKWIDGVAANGTFTKPYALAENYGVNYIPQGWTVEINDYSSAPLTFEAVGDSVTIELHNENDPQQISLNYNKNGTGWTSVTINDPISLDAGDKIAFRGDNDKFNSFDWDAYTFTSTGNGSLKVLGNIMSLLTSDFADKTAFDMLNYNSGVFRQLFKDLSNLVDASNLVLPVTNFADYSNTSVYQQMFDGCGSLTAAPILPATSLAPYCYYEMFRYCGNLSTVPSGMLPATDLAQSCYEEMFMYCSYLTDAPELPATTLTTDCYKNMFNGCGSLSSINVNFTTWGYSEDWVYDVAANGTFTKPADLYETYDDDCIPSNWIVVNK